MKTRQTWIEGTSDLAVKRQCVLAKVSRANAYALRKEHTVCQITLTLKRLIDEEYTRHPFYGARRMVIYLARMGHVVNRKRVQRLMRQMGLAGMAPGPNTSKSHPEHKVYPYLLRGVSITRPNQVWSTDITYIRLERGFAYLVAIIDWYSRRVLGWRISNSMDASFCVECLADTIKIHGKPEVFNSDQGSQFTSEAFTGVLKAHQITISMDGRGRAFDNIFVERLWRTVKYEHVVPTKIVKMYEAGHPLPDANGVRGTQALVELLGGVKPEDKLVASGASFLSEGDLVKVVDSMPNVPAAPASQAQAATK